MTCLVVTHKGLRLKLAEKSVILSFGLACGVLMIFPPLSLSLSLSLSWKSFLDILAKESCLTNEVTEHI